MYRTLHAILHEFEGGYGHLSFEVMTHDFYDAFKTFLVTAEVRGASIPKNYRKFKVDEEDVEVVALTWGELQRIHNIDLAEQPRLDRIRALFLFACCTGARFGDVQKPNIDDIRGTVWHLRMGKTRSETRIHLIPQAVALVNKYRRDGRIPTISSQSMNDYLKELGQLAEINEPVRIVRYQGAKRVEDRGPKWQFLSSHVARRIFVTISLERGMRPEVVMSITGHRSFKTMKKYIALTEQSRREALEAAWNK